MVIICNKTPFHHIIVKETFGDVPYQEVWDELVFLKLRMQGPEQTGASTSNTDPKDVRKKGVGVFLNKIYTDLSVSSIVFQTKRFLTDKRLTDKIQGLAEENYYFKHWNPEVLMDSFLAQYYDHGDFYKSHHDTALFSSVTVLHQTPKQYLGGNFVFPEFDYVVELEDNMSIIFPSVITHAIDELEIQKSGKMLGRFSITNFLNLRV